MLLNTRDLQLMSAFESMTRARAVDCFEAEGCINFIVKKGDLGKALGKGGATISNVRKKMDKRVMVFEDSDNPREFIEKACSPVKANPVIGDNSVSIEVPRSQREDIHGREMRIIKEAVSRKLDIPRVDFSFV